MSLRGDVSYAVASDVADELERTQKDHDCVRTTWIVPAKIWPLRVNSPTVGPHTKQRVPNYSAFREVCNRRVTHEVIWVEARKTWQRTTTSNARPRRHKRICFPTKKEPGEFPMSTPERKLTSMMESVLWVRPCVQRPKPRTRCRVACWIVKAMR